MASECAIMGTPSMYINSLSAGTLEDQEQKGILYMYISSNGLIEKTKEILTTPKAKEEAKKRKSNFNWDLIIVPRVGHDNRLIAPYAKTYLFNNLNSTK